MPIDGQRRGAEALAASDDHERVELSASFARDVHVAATAHKHIAYAPHDWIWKASQLIAPMQPERRFMAP